MNFPTQTQTLPPVYVTEADHEILSNLAQAVADRAAGSRVLASEMARAVIVEPGDAPRPFASIGSTLEYQDLSSGQVRRVRLSLPRDASIDEGRISVLTPVGAALIGMTAGETFQWTGHDGRPRGVRALSIEA
ncbi:GreA/GreB family elongation factor [Caulobacter sp. DWR1-3-2b1]|uniref:GreA/GreB family elongation factor n=1 Tax=Caulobacter sp. DWR1-3-2b1 TaxID=2804670 RepID=UPI003CF7DC19